MPKFQFSAAALLTLAIWAGPLPALAASKAETKLAVNEVTSHDGLVQVKSKQADLV